MSSINNIEFLTFLENKIPEFKELKSKGIAEYGEKNLFPDDLIYLLNKSSKHNAIVQQKALYITGEDTLGVDQSIKDSWNKYDTLQEFKYKCTLDAKTFGGLAVEVIYDRALKPHFYHIDFSKIRTLNHMEYYYADDWSKAKKDDYKVYAKYDPETKQFGVKQLFYYREYRSGLGIYPLPEYYPALNYIDIDARISNFHLNNIASGFTAGTLLELFKGEPTPEEARMFKRKFHRDFTGDSNAGALIIQFNEKNEPGAKVTPLQSNDFDKMFIELNKQVESDIFIAHQVTSPMLLGVKEEGQLGGRNELATAYEIFYRSYIRPNQQKLDAIYTMFLNDMGIATKVETVRFEPLELDFVELFKEGIADRNEVRERLGLGVSVQMSEQSDESDMRVFAVFGEDEDYFEFEELNEKELKIVAAVKDNEIATLKELSTLTKIDEKEVKKILEVLDQKGKISYTSKAIKITDSNILNQTLVVKYKYGLRPDAPDLIGDSSRPFCERLIKLGRVYSREEIEKMSAVLGFMLKYRYLSIGFNPALCFGNVAFKYINTAVTKVLGLAGLP